MSMAMRREVEHADLYAKCAMHAILRRADAALRVGSTDEEFETIQRHRAAVRAAAPYLWPEATTGEGHGNG